ncbi:nascent polypeptide-associated complex subunit alpha, muscle-specific form-like [Mustela nigripes]|uniref:nascent polypeptide-associated complex subunit alpha, muscle-specific form-like n=1 Tax=Mustela nigripes TaxID=77151 RepID=UPI002816969C|nr:nascent polypeptide-associated complex subunit alpha, muscle-specific form-like [Mustela nigripes]
MLGLHNEHLLQMRGGFTTNYPGASEGRSVSGHSPRNVLETRPQKSSRTPSAPRPRGDPGATPRRSRGDPAATPGRPRGDPAAPARTQASGQGPRLKLHCLRSETAFPCRSVSSLPGQETRPPDRGEALALSSSSRSCSGSSSGWRGRSVAVRGTPRRAAGPGQSRLRAAGRARGSDCRRSVAASPAGHTLLRAGRTSEVRRLRRRP